MKISEIREKYANSDPELEAEFDTWVGEHTRRTAEIGWFEGSAAGVRAFTLLIEKGQAEWPDNPYVATS